MQVAWIVGGVGVAAVATAVAVIVHTRWLQSRTLEKCVGLSLLLHAVLAAVCALVGGLAPASWGTEDEGRMTMLVVVADDAGEGRPRERDRLGRATRGHDESDGRHHAAERDRDHRARELARAAVAIT